MQVDRNRFFREAALCICGSLEAPKFLHETLTTIQDFLPADRIFWIHLYPEQHQQHLVARADSQAGTLLNIYLPMPEGAGSHRSGPGSETVVMERAGQLPSMQPLIDEGLCAESDSLLMIRLIIGQEAAGAVVFCAREGGRFTAEHADLISLLVEPFTVALKNGMAYQQLFGRKELLAEDNRFLRSELSAAAGEEIVGARYGLKSVTDQARSIAPLSSPVLLIGEPGTGKQVIARAIHSYSRRVEDPFIKINCSSIPENLLAAELFGDGSQVRNNDPARHSGLIERSGSGTIFFERISQLSAQAQGLLLQVAGASGTGCDEPIAQSTASARVIAAADTQLLSLVKRQKFSSDLYRILNTSTIVIPPLRERTGDIIALVQHFILRFSREMGLSEVPQVSPAAFSRLRDYPWPGNVRELENVVEREIMLADGSQLTFVDLAQREQRRIERLAGDRISERPGIQLQPLDRVIAQHIRHVLKITGGKVGGSQGAAELLAVNPSTLRKRMRKLGIPFGRQARH